MPKRHIFVIGPESLRDGVARKLGRLTDFELIWSQQVNIELLLQPFRPVVTVIDGRHRKTDASATVQHLRRVHPAALVVMIERKPTASGPTDGVVRMTQKDLLAKVISLVQRSGTSRAPQQQLRRPNQRP